MPRRSSVLYYQCCNRQTSLWSRNREIGVQHGAHQLEPPRWVPVFSEDSIMILELTSMKYWRIYALKCPFAAPSGRRPPKNPRKVAAHWIEVILTAESSWLCNSRVIMYQKMSLVQKIGDQVCVLAVAGLWGGIEGAPICMDRRTTRAGDKDLINK